MTNNFSPLYVDSLHELICKGNIQEICNGELVICLPYYYHLNDTLFKTKTEEHYDVIVLPIDIFINNGFETLIINKSNCAINILVSRAKYINNSLLKNVVLLHDLSQNYLNSYLILKSNCHKSVEIINLGMNTSHLFYIYWLIFIIGIGLIIYLYYMTIKVYQEFCYYFV